MQQPRVSIVINTLDRAESLERTLTSLRLLRYSNFEVVVVQGPCSDTTADVLARHAAFVRIGSCPHANLAMSRNVGIAMARGEIIAFLDDDAVPEPDWLDRLVGGLCDAAIAAVGGFIRDHNGINFQHRIVIADRFGDAEYDDRWRGPVGPGRYVSPTGTNIALRRDALIAIGGFDEYYAYFLDETDVNLRLFDNGRKLALIPDAEVHHKFSASSVRAADRVPRSMYLIARSKSYFCWVNARGRHSVAQISDNLAKWRRKQRRKLRRLRFVRKIDATACKRLIEEVEKGVEDGARDARSQVARRLISEELVRKYASGEFQPYLAPKSAGLRLCFLSHEFPPHGQTEIGQWTREVALDLATRGHEVTVICVSPERYPSVDFADGIWVHRIIAKPISKALREEFPFAPPRLLRYSAAVADEIVRTRPRRDYQVVIGPLVDLEATVALPRTGLRTIVTLHASRQTPQQTKYGWLFRRWSSEARGYRAAQTELLRAASLILFDTPALLESMSHTAHGDFAAEIVSRESSTRSALTIDGCLSPKFAVAASFDALESHIARAAAAYG